MNTHPYIITSALMVFVILFDCVTGLLKAKINKNINSPQSSVGALKKIAVLFSMIFGFMLDIIFDFIMLYLEVGTSVRIPFGTIIGIYLILSECISICENLYMSGVKLPSIITEALKIAQEKIEKNKSCLHF